MKKSILLTGASSGIGKTIATKLANNDFMVLATVRKEEDKHTLEAISSNIKCFFLDVTKKEEIKNLFNQIKKETDSLAGIINNAGCAYTNIIEYADIDEIREQFEINTFAPIEITKTFLPLMKKGKIINISSVSSNVVYPYISPYCASKKSLDIFFQALLLEMDNQDIKIVSIKPGVVKTPIWEKSLDAAQKRFAKLPDIAQKKYKNKLYALLDVVRQNVKNGIEPEDVANLVLKVINKNNPKLSYNIGIGAHIGGILSKFSPDFQCFILKNSEKCLRK